MLTSKERAHLRSMSNELETIIQVGKADIGENLIAQVNGALDTRELIKLRVLETSEYSAKEAADYLAKATVSQVVQVIGSRFVLYRRNGRLPKEKRIEP